MCKLVFLFGLFSLNSYYNVKKSLRAESVQLQRQECWWFLGCSLRMGSNSVQ